MTKTRARGSPNGSGIRGHAARHVNEALDYGVTDGEIVEYASRHRFQVLTHDDDFLDPELARRVSILYYSDDTLGTNELTERVEQVIRVVPDPSELPRITNIGAWE